MPKLLKNINIQFLSLVKKGANKRQVIFKTAENPPDLREIQITKTDDAKQMVYGIVYAPDDIDLHDEFSTAEEIEAASHRFMKSLNNLNIDKQHSFVPEGAFVAENWIIRKGDPLFPQEKEGAWAVGIKIEDAALYKEAKENLHAISMAGTADKVVQKEENDEETKSLLKRLLQYVKETINPKEKDDMDAKDIQKMIDDSIAPIKAAIEKIPAPLTEEALSKIIKAAMPEMIKPVEERIEKIEKASPGSVQPDPVKEAEEDAKLVEIGKRIAKMAMGQKEGGK